MIPVEAVFFAIQAGVRLHGALRKAYVEGTRARALALPLPRTEGRDFSSADNWFRNDASGKEAAKQYPRIVALLAGQAPLSEAQRREVLETYVVASAEHMGDDPGGNRGQLAARELNALLEIRQWTDAQPGKPPSALQRIAGTIVEVAVDYFLATPGAVSDRRPEGRALRAFLEAIDDTKFSETPVEDIAADLLIGVLDGVRASPDLLGGGSNERAFVASVTDALSTSAAKHLEEATTQERWEASAWLQIIARSVLKSGSETVLANPVRFLGVRAGAEANVVQRVGGTLADLLIGPEGASFQRLISAEGLDTIARSALDAVARNPDILRTDDEGLKGIVVSIASELAEHPKLVSTDILPDLVRLVLERGADSLDLVWPPGEKPERHLLIAASRAVLRALAEPGGGTWRPRFTKEQVLELIEVAAAEAIENPDWLVKEAADEHERLGVVLRAILDSLRALDGARFSVAGGLKVLEAGIAAAARNLSFLDRLPDGDRVERAITSALDTIFAAILAGNASSGAAWRLARTASLQAIVEVALEALSRVKVDAEALRIVSDVLTELVASDRPLDLEALARELAGRLATVVSGS